MARVIAMFVDSYTGKTPIVWALQGTFACVHTCTHTLTHACMHARTHSCASARAHAPSFACSLGCHQDVVEILVAAGAETGGTGETAEIRVAAERGAVGGTEETGGTEGAG